MTAPEVPASVREAAPKDVDWTHLVEIIDDARDDADCYGNLPEGHLRAALLNLPAPSRLALIGALMPEGWVAVERTMGIDLSVRTTTDTPEKDKTE